MTKTVIWSLISSYYENLPLPNSGPMKANTPWSGPLRSCSPRRGRSLTPRSLRSPAGSTSIGACGLLKEGGSYVCLRSPAAGGDYSIIIETIDAKTPQTFSFRVTGGLATGPIHVWRSNAQSQFDRRNDVSPADGAFMVNLEPGCIYSLTTTSGQCKGTTEIPPPADFPLPYRDDFESDLPGKMPKYFADQGGVFEVAERPGGGRCIRQAASRRGIDWIGHPNPAPYTLIGSTQWRDYEVNCDVRVEQSGYASILGRIIGGPQTADPPQGYWLKVNTDGRWQLKALTKTLAAGAVSHAAGRWHRLALKFAGPMIVASIDGAEVKAIEDRTFDRGMAGLGSGWHRALFDNFSVLPIADARQGRQK